MLTVFIPQVLGLENQASNEKKTGVWSMMIFDSVCKRGLVLALTERIIIVKEELENKSNYGNKMD